MSDEGFSFFVSLRAARRARGVAAAGAPSFLSPPQAENRRTHRHNSFLDALFPSQRGDTRRPRLSFRLDGPGARAQNKHSPTFSPSPRPFAVGLCLLPLLIFLAAGDPLFSLSGARLKPQRRRGPHEGLCASDGPQGRPSRCVFSMIWGGREWTRREREREVSLTRGGLSLQLGAGERSRRGPDFLRPAPPCSSLPRPAPRRLDLNRRLTSHPNRPISQ